MKAEHSGTLGFIRNFTFFALVLIYCSCSTEISPTNPYDPDTPTALKSTGSISGMVVLEARNSVSGIEVSLEDSGSKAVPNRETGKFQLNKVAPGVYQVRVHDVAHLSEYRDHVLFGVRVDPGVHVDLGEIFLPIFRGTLQGAVQLLDETGTPLGTHEGVVVSLVPAGFKNDGSVREPVDYRASAVTGGDGLFVFENIPVGEYNVVAAKTGYVVAGTEKPVLVRKGSQASAGVLALQPASGAVAIFSGKQFTGLSEPYTTTREVKLHVRAFHAKSMIISNYPDFSEPETVPIEADTIEFDHPWILTQGDGEKTVYVKFITEEDTETDVCTGRIVLDSTPPIGQLLQVGEGKGYMTDPTVVLAISAVDQGENLRKVSGVTQMKISLDGRFDTEQWEPYNVRKTETFSPEDGEKRVMVLFRDAAGNQSLEPLEATVVLDTRPPDTSLGGLRIEDGAQYVTKREVLLTLAVEGAAYMLLSDASSFTGAQWEPFVSPRLWTLPPGDGEKTVYVKFKDEAGNESDAVSDTIVLDTTPPIGTIKLQGDGMYSTSRRVSLELSTDDPAVNQVQVSEYPDFHDCTWSDFQSSLVFELSPGDGTKTLFARFRDPAGNVSTTSTMRVELDTQPPGEATLSIAGGSPFSVSRQLPLSLHAVGAAEMKVSDNLSCNGGEWRPFARQTVFLTGQEEGEVAVSVVFRDAAGNESSCVSDTITLDLTPPQGPSIIVAGGADAVHKRTIELALTAVDAREMLISESDSFQDADWRPFRDTVEFILSAGDGAKEVFAKFRDKAGNETTAVSDTVLLDTTGDLDATVWLEEREDMGGALATLSGLGGTFTQTSSSPTGALSFRSVPNGSYSLLVTLPGYEDVYHPSVTVSPGAVTKLGQIKLFLARGGIAGRASLASAFDHSGIVIELEGETRTAVTNSEGYYEINDLRVGDYMLWARKKGYVRTRIGRVAVVESTTSTAPDVTLAKQEGDFSINNGAGYTNSRTVELTDLSWPGAVDFMVSEDESFLDPSMGDTSWRGGFEPGHQPPYTHILTSGDGYKTLYLKFLTGTGQESSVLRAGIFLDTTPPPFDGGSITINDGSKFCTSPAVTLHLDAHDAGEGDGTASGIAMVRLSWNQDMSGAINTEYSGTYNNWMLGQAPVSDGLKHVYAVFVDKAGNESKQPVTAQVYYDTTPPGSVSLRIGTGGQYTTTPFVVLSMSGQEPCDPDYPEANGCTLGFLEPYRMMVSQTEGFLGAVWEPYTTVRNFTLIPGDGQKTVYLKVADQAGNVSGVVSASMVLDTTPPSPVSMSLTPAPYTATRQVSVLLEASDATEMQLAEDVLFTGATWQAYVGNTRFDLSDRDGQHTVFVRFRDAAGNVSDPLSAITVLDRVPPEGAYFTILQGEYTTVPRVDLALYAVGATEMSLSEGDTCTGSWVPFDNTYVLPLTDSAGEKSVSARFRDEAGNETACLTQHVVYDPDPPAEDRIGVAIVGNLPGSPERTSSRQVLISMTYPEEDTAAMQVSDDLGFPGAAWQVVASEIAWTLPPGDGAKTVYARFKDEAGNVSVTVSDSIQLDQTPPQNPTVEVDEGETTPTRTIHLTLSAVDATEMIIAENQSFSGASWQQYEGSAEYEITSPGDGIKVIYAKFRDGFLNETETVSDMVVLDTGAPSSPMVVINSGAEYTTDRNVILGLSAGGATRYATSLNGVDFETWQDYAPSVAFLLPDSDGSHTVYVKFQDDAGNETAMVSDSIVLDRQPPENPAVVIQDGSTYTTQRNVVLTLSASGASAMKLGDQHALSGAVWTTFSPSIAYTLSLPEGTKTVYARFRDEAGNETETVWDDIVLDMTPPGGNSVVIAGGDAYTTNRSVDITLSTDEPASTLMQVSNWSDFHDLGQGDWSPFSVMVQHTLTEGQGTKLVYARFKDPAGNISPVVSDSIVYDSIAPEGGQVTINNGDEVTNDRSLVLTLWAPGAASMKVSDDSTCNGGTVESYSTSKALTTTQPEGLVTVSVMFYDEAGNASQCVTDSIMFDQKPPSSPTVVINDGDDFTKSSIVTLGISAQGADYMMISNDAAFAGATWRPYNTSVAWSLEEGEGIRTVYVRFRDAAGNPTGAPVEAQDSITVDSIAPGNAGIVIDGGATYSNSATHTCTLTITHDGTASEMMLSNTQDFIGATWVPVQGTVTNYDFGASEGTKTVFAKLRDDAKNESGTIFDSIVYDITPPQSTSMTIDGGDPVTNSPNLLLNLSAVGATRMKISDNGTCNGGTAENYTGTKAFTTTQPEGTVTLSVVYYDAAGNASACITDDIELDQTPPENASLQIVSLGGDDTHTASRNVRLNIAANGATQMRISNNAACTGGTWEDYATIKEWTLVNGGDNVQAWVSVTFKDAAGNTSQCISDDILIDTVAPVPTAFQVEAGGTDTYYTNSSSLYITALAASGTWSTAELSENMAFSTVTATISYPPSFPVSYTLQDYASDGSRDGQKRIFARFKDAVGNTSAIIESDVYLDTVAPVFTDIQIDDDDDYTDSNLFYVTMQAQDTASGVHYAYLDDDSSPFDGTRYTYDTLVTYSYADNTSGIKTVWVGFEDLAGNRSEAISDQIHLDVGAPSSVSFTIDGGASCPANITNNTLVTLAITASDDQNGSGIAEVKIAENADFDLANWQAYIPNKAFVLSAANGNKVIGLKVRDFVGHESTASNRCIILDTQPPSPVSVSVQEGDKYYKKDVTLSVHALDNISGASDLWMWVDGSDVSKFTNSGGSGVNRWMPYASGTATLSDGDGTKHIYVKYRDRAGNETQFTTDTVLLDTSPPQDVISDSIEAGFRQVSVSWQPSHDAESGITGYYVYYGTSPSLMDGTWAYEGDSPVFVTGPTANNITLHGMEHYGVNYYFGVKAVNGAQNISEQFGNTLSTCSRWEGSKMAMSTASVPSIYDSFRCENYMLTLVGGDALEYVYSPDHGHTWEEGDSDFEVSGSYISGAGLCLEDPDDANTTYLLGAFLEDSSNRLIVKRKRITHTESMSAWYAPSGSYDPDAGLDMVSLGGKIMLFAQDSGSKEIVMQTYDNDTDTWSAASIANPGYKAYEVRACASDHTVIVAWRNAPENVDGDVFQVRSGNGGLSFGSISSALATSVQGLALDCFRAGESSNDTAVIQVFYDAAQGKCAGILSDNAGIAYNDINTPGFDADITGPPSVYAEAGYINIALSLSSGETKLGLLRSEDGGTSWRRMQLPGSYDDLDSPAEHLGVGGHAGGSVYISGVALDKGGSGSSLLEVYPLLSAPVDRTLISPYELGNTIYSNWEPSGTDNPPYYAVFSDNDGPPWESFELINGGSGHWTGQSSDSYSNYYAIASADSPAPRRVFSDQSWTYALHGFTSKTFLHNGSGVLLFHSPGYYDTGMTDEDVVWTSATNEGDIYASAYRSNPPNVAALFSDTSGCVKRRAIALAPTRDAIMLYYCEGGGQTQGVYMTTCDLAAGSCSSREGARIPFVNDDESKMWLDFRPDTGVNGWDRMLAISTSGSLGHYALSATVWDERGSDGGKPGWGRDEMIVSTGNEVVISPRIAEFDSRFRYWRVYGFLPGSGLEEFRRDSLSGNWSATTIAGTSGLYVNNLSTAHNNRDEILVVGESSHSSAETRVFIRTTPRKGTNPSWTSFVLNTSTFLLNGKGPLVWAAANEETLYIMLSSTSQDVNGNVVEYSALYTCYEDCYGPKAWHKNTLLSHVYPITSYTPQSSETTVATPPLGSPYNDFGAWNYLMSSGLIKDPKDIPETLLLMNGANTRWSPRLRR
ncbi:MAG: hypothetical protein GXP49_08190 [Deltaproteobacteria bacterium]|nr:hypothetical protein [Deltaproteobacteria bacterium]